MEGKKWKLSENPTDDVLEGWETTLKLETILQINSQVKAERKVFSSSSELAQEWEAGSGEGHIVRMLEKIW